MRGVVLVYCFFSLLSLPYIIPLGVSLYGNNHNDAIARNKESGVLSSWSSSEKKKKMRLAEGGM